MKPNGIIESLRNKGIRITRTREVIVSILSTTKSPLSADGLLQKLHRLGLKVNKTTVYRELEFLARSKIISSVHVDDCSKYYELASGHHHHVVCEKCSELVDVNTTAIEKYLQKTEKRLAKMIRFNSVRHSLEFFGVCTRCQKIV